jgi:hypothetical protein
MIAGVPPGFERDTSGIRVYNLMAILTSFCHSDVEFKKGGAYLNSEALVHQ